MQNSKPSILGNQWTDFLNYALCKCMCISGHAQLRIILTFKRN